MASRRVLLVLALVFAPQVLLTGAARTAPEQQQLIRRKHLPIDFADGDDASVRAHWALLVAGSAGWGNYRHQADVLHAHAVLKRGGLREDHMVIMAYDDLAGSYENPLPGKVVNRPGGPDLYAGVTIDYRGDDVNSKNFLAVLAGDKAAMRGIGTGRVIDSGPHDRVFLFYSDHGAAGVLGMPSGPFLYADELMRTLAAQHDAKKFKELVMYIEACESGSMFEGLLPDNASIYVTTAANAYESSWATYCPTFGVDDQPSMSTCLGDLYSVAWMENSEQADLTKETLEQQYELVKARTSNNFTYMQGSHVMQYGALEIDAEVAGDYIGMWNNGSGPQPAPAPSILPALKVASGAGSDFAGMFAAMVGANSKGSSYQHAPQRHADLLPLLHAVHKGSDAGTRVSARAQLASALHKRQAVDDAAAAAVRTLLVDARAAPLLLLSLGFGAQQVYPAAQPVALAAAQQLLTAATQLQQVSGAVLATSMPGSGEGAYPLPITWPGIVPLLGAPDHVPMQLLVAHHMGRPRKGVPLVDSWDCLRGMVQAWELQCGPMDQYAMRHTRMMANLCNARLEPAHLAQALERSGSCGSSRMHDSAQAVRPS